MAFSHAYPPGNSLYSAHTTSGACAYAGVVVDLGDPPLAGLLLLQERWFMQLSSNNKKQYLPVSWHPACDAFGLATLRSFFVFGRGSTCVRSSAQNGFEGAAPFKSIALLYRT